MKRLEILIILKIIVASICLTNLTVLPANAQRVGVYNIDRSTKTRETVKKTSAPAKPKTKIIYEKSTQYIEKISSPTGINIITTPNADITLEEINSTKKKRDVREGKADNNGIISFEKLLPSKYKLSASLEGYESQEQEIEIISKKMLVNPFYLEKVKYEFSIKTNVNEGEVLFAPVKIEKKADGTENMTETGSYCVIPLKNQTATLKDLLPGTYNLDISAPDSPEYQPRYLTIKIPDDIPDADSGKPEEISFLSIELENTLSETTFILSSVQENWKLPETWKIDSTGLKVNGIGIAFPKAKSYRYYKDFEMQSSVRMSDNIAVGFVVRAIDENNYYLIKLTGDASRNQYLVSAVIYKDGKPKEQVLSLGIGHVIKKAVVEKKDFEVIIKAQGDKFEIFATDVENGERVPLGRAEFKDNNYPIGAVGIGVDEKANFEVIRFMVCNQICKE